MQQIYCLLRVKDARPADSNIGIPVARLLPPDICSDDDDNDNVRAFGRVPENPPGGEILPE